MKLARTLAAALAGLSLLHVVSAADCGMSLAFRQPDEGGKTMVPVWQDDARTALLFAEALKVNTDGTKRSYSVDDFWGKRVAINNLCNAMSDACKGLTQKEKEARVALTQKAKAGGWPADLLRQTKIDSRIIVFRDGKPCPEVDGFLVSATALENQKVSDRCDLSRYIDAIAVSAIVLPGRLHSTPTGFETRNAKIGDLVVVLTPKSDRPMFAVVGDIGPATELGEASVALNGALLGKTQEPENYDAVKRQWGVPAAFVLVLPGTRDIAEPFLTQPRIDQAGRQAFERWGGMERFAACRLAYRNR
jgi:hypothetical protein